jgi:hypothetical protein
MAGKALQSRATHIIRARKERERRWGREQRCSALAFLFSSFYPIQALAYRTVQLTFQASLHCLLIFSGNMLIDTPRNMF